MEFQTMFRNACSQRRRSTRWAGAACVMASMLSLPSAAQSSQPGLWENRTTIHSAAGGQMAQQMAQMQRDMAAMPADQRRMMEQMMAKQGISMGPNGATTVRYCMSPEEAAQAQIPSHDKDCKYTLVNRSGNRLNMTFVCSDEGKTQGEGEVVFNSPKAYSGKFKMQTTVDGRPERITMDQSGRWLAADCGTLKPRQR